MSTVFAVAFAIARRSMHDSFGSRSRGRRLPEIENLLHPKIRYAIQLDFTLTYIIFLHRILLVELRSVLELQQMITMNFVLAGLCRHGNCRGYILAHRIVSTTSVNSPKMRAHTEHPLLALERAITCVFMECIVYIKWARKNIFTARTSTLQ